MDGLKAWCSALCLTALGCAALRLLAPKNGIGKLFHLVVATFFLCSVLHPFLQLGKGMALDIDTLPDAVVDELLEDTVNRQLRQQVETTVTTLVEESLSNRKVVAEKIEVKTDISDEGGIYIQHIIITVDKQQHSAAMVVREVLERQLGTMVEVKGR